MPDRTHCVYTTQTRSPPTRLQRLTQGLRLMRYRFKAQALPMLVAIVLVAVVERPLVSVGSDSVPPVANSAQEFSLGSWASGSGVA